MRCPRCQITLANPPVVDRRRRYASNLVRLFGDLACPRCGEKLHPWDEGEAMLTKLSQLSQFGLGADDRRVLAPDPPAE